MKCVFTFVWAAWAAACFAAPPVAEAAKPEADGETALSGEEASQGQKTENQKPADGFERYRTILDRMPFGQPPPGFNPETPGAASAGGRGGAGADGAMTPEQLSEEEQRLAAAVRVSVLNVTPAGVPMAGFTDSSDSKTPRHYYLGKGQERDGWKVVDLSPEERSVTLSKDGVEITLKLGEASGQGAKGGSRSVAAAAGCPRPAAFAGKSGGMPPPQANALPSPASAAPGPAVGGLARLRLQRQQMQARSREDEAKRAAAAEAAKKEREEEKARAEEERQQQREQLLQIQEELRRQREEAAKKKEQEAAAAAAAAAAPAAEGEATAEN